MKLPIISTKEVAWTDAIYGEKHKPIKWQSMAEQNDIRIYGEPASSPAMSISSLNEKCEEIALIAKLSSGIIKGDNNKLKKKTK